MCNGEREEVDIGDLIAPEDFAEMDALVVEYGHVIRPKLMVKLSGCPFEAFPNLINADRATQPVVWRIQYADNTVFHQRTGRYFDASLINEAVGASRVRVCIIQ